MSRSEAEVSFDWPMYADATFAGLSLLVPIPLLDWVFEQFFAVASSMLSCDEAAQHFPRKCGRRCRRSLAATDSLADA